MKRYACNYSIVRFCPYLDTGEFANVGIALFAPDSGKFGFKLQRKKYARLTSFFVGLDKNVYLKSIADLDYELNRVNDEFKKVRYERNFANRREVAQRLFTETTRGRESILKFGEIRTILVTNFEKKLVELFGHYVERDYSQARYDERLLENEIRAYLEKNSMAHRFQPRAVGDADYHVNFPFVSLPLFDQLAYKVVAATKTSGINYRQSNRPPILDITDDYVIEPSQIIKPLYFDLKTTTSIIEKGARWRFRVEELHRRRVTEPDRVFFSVHGPVSDSKHGEAFSLAKKTLVGAGAKVFDHASVEEVLTS